MTLPNTKKYSKVMPGRYIQSISYVINESYEVLL